MPDQPTSRRGIVLMNLGSPDSTKVPDVKRYLDEFLMDKRIIDYPYLFRLLLVKGMITPKRSPQSAEAYEKVWWPEGSPLIVLTDRLKEALETRITEPVEVAMRYGNPHPAVAYRRLMERVPDLKEVILFSLYPQYAMSSYETAVEYAREVYRQGNYPFRLRVIRPFYDESRYIAALAESIRPHLEDSDYLLFSFHGVPERHIRKGDITHNHCLKTPDCCAVDSPAHQFCYRHQVLKTVELTARALSLPADRYGQSFQSRLGRDPWLQPYTAATLEALPGRGIKKLVVACPAFVSDCLETLEEIAIQGKETFMKAGGESFRMAPCLNVQPQWVDLLASWVREYSEGDQSMILPE
jgi:ferrochelatase